MSDSSPSAAVAAGECKCEPNIESQLLFAKHALDHSFDMIKFMDTKAATAMVSATFMVTVSVWCMRALLDLPSRDSLLPFTTTAAFIAQIAFLVPFAHYLMRTIVPRAGADRMDKEMLFPLRVCRDHESPKDYLVALTASDGRSLLNQYAHSILNLSRIYICKQEAVTKAIGWLRISIVPWAVLVLIRLLFLFEPVQSTLFGSPVLLGVVLCSVAVLAIVVVFMS